MLDLDDKFQALVSKLTAAKVKTQIITTPACVILNTILISQNPQFLLLLLRIIIISSTKRRYDDS